MHSKRILPILLLSILAFFICAYPKTYANDELPKLIFFYSPSCSRCIQIKNELMPKIEKEYAGKLLVEYLDTTVIENYKFLLSLEEKYKAKIKNAWPVFYLGGYFLNGEGKVEDNLRALIAVSLKKDRAAEKESLPSVDLIAYFKSFRPLAIITAGLTDGINPCAFTVIVFFISFLSLQGYQKKELTVIGLCFIFAVFITYLVIGMGLFGFFYRLKSFWLIAKILNFSIGVFSIILGFAALYDFFKFKKTKQTEGLWLQLPKAVKNRIHSLIGLHYRRKEKESSRPHIFRLALSALITGILVSILEAVCTGQVYLPTITFVLKTTPLKLQALGYLLLYNLMFIIPLLIIFLFALWGVTSEQFSQILKKRLLGIKILMAIIFFGLGILLLWRP